MSKRMDENERRTVEGILNSIVGQVRSVGAECGCGVESSPAQYDYMSASAKVFLTPHGQMDLVEFQKRLRGIQRMEFEIYASDKDGITMTAYFAPDKKPRKRRCGPCAMTLGVALFGTICTFLVHKFALQ